MLQLLQETAWRRVALLFPGCLSWNTRGGAGLRGRVHPGTALVPPCALVANVPAPSNLAGDGPRVDPFPTPPAGPAAA